MTMASERTVWAEGMGFSDELVEELTLIAEEASERCRDQDIAEQFGCEQPNLMTSDLSQWVAELERFGFEDLAECVRALDPN